MGSKMIKPTNATVSFNHDTQEYEVFLTFPEGKCSLQSIPVTENLYYRQALLQKLVNTCIRGVRE